MRDASIHARVPQFMRESGTDEKRKGRKRGGFVLTPWSVLDSSNQNTGEMPTNNRGLNALPTADAG